jgi:hypothetical protein
MVSVATADVSITMLLASDACGSFAVITKTTNSKKFSPFVSAAQQRGSTLVMGRKFRYCTMSKNGSTE